MTHVNQNKEKSLHELENEEVLMFCISFSLLFVLCSLITNCDLETASAVDQCFLTVNYSGDPEVSKKPLFSIRNVLLRHSAHFQQ